MKIFCIGLNYREHIDEMKHFNFPDNPVIFMKSATALLKDQQPFYYPDFSKDINYEGEIVLRICKNGKKIEEQFAHKYYDSFSLGFDFTARDLQADLKKKGWPWEISKSFDQSACVGEFIPLEKNKHIDFTIKKNGELMQHGNTEMLIFSFDKIVSYVSQFFTLQQGDLIYTGTPKGVGAVAIGDTLEGYIGSQKLLHCEIR